MIYLQNFFLVDRNSVFLRSGSGPRTSPCDLLAHLLMTVFPCSKLTFATAKAIDTTTATPHQFVSNDFGHLAKAKVAGIKTIVPRCRLITDDLSSSTQLLLVRFLFRFRPGLKTGTNHQLYALEQKLVPFVLPGCEQRKQRGPVGGGNQKDEVDASPVPRASLADLPLELLDLILEFYSPRNCPDSTCSCDRVRPLLVPLMTACRALFNSVAPRVYDHLGGINYRGFVKSTEAVEIFFEALDSPRGDFYASCVRQVVVFLSPSSPDAQVAVALKTMDLLPHYMSRFRRLRRIHLEHGGMLWLANGPIVAKCTGILFAARKVPSIQSVVTDYCLDMSIVSTCLKGWSELEVLQLFIQENLVQAGPGLEY